MKVVSLFSGAGGLDLGFKMAGHEVIWANDIDKDSVDTYRKNIGGHIVLGEVRKIDCGSIPSCDIVIGGFPCQGFSVANTKRHTKDARNRLYLELLRVVKCKSPEYFLAENVKGLASLGKGKILQMIVKDFEHAGYRVSYKILNSADYGVPQIRERIIIVGVRKDLPSSMDYQFPKPTHCKIPSERLVRMSPWVSVGDALNGIPEPAADNALPNHVFSAYKLRFNNYLGHRTINPGKPAPTVTARGDERGGVVVMHHPSNRRRMTARELAAVQSFPIDFEFSGCMTSCYRQIGNAVPPLLAKAVASCFPR